MQWFERLTVDCVQADLLKSDVDVIGCNTNIMMNLNYSLGKQLRECCGNALTSEISKLQESLPEKQLKLGQAEWINVEVSESIKAIIFFGWWSAENEFTASLIYKCFANVLRLAFEKRVKSIALPLFGSGSGSLDFRVFEESVSLVLYELNKLKNSDTFSVEEILFVSTRVSLVDRLNETLLRVIR